MLTRTLADLQCPSGKCATSGKSTLRLEGKSSKHLSDTSEEVTYGTLSCTSCKRNYPILAGVAILVEHPEDYLLSHIKGISREVPEASFPKEFRSSMIRAKREIVSEHIEEDLESERVTALYLATHYLKAEGGWWRADSASGSKELEELILKYWDHGPFERIRVGLRELSDKKLSCVELGCGAGGLLNVLRGQLSSYIGVDSSFSSIADARKILITREPVAFKIPGDLLLGTLGKEVPVEIPPTGIHADFIVSDATEPALVSQNRDVCVSLNMIDMLEHPESLPEIQKNLIRPGGLAIQSSPYVWHPETARALRRKLPKEIRDSREAVRHLYKKAGFKIARSEEQVPWLFFKQVRQIELYSVDLLFAIRSIA